MEINGDIPMPTSTVVADPELMSDLEEVIEESSRTVEAKSSNSDEESKSSNNKIPVVEKNYRYVKIGLFYYMSEIVKPYVKAISINKDLFDSNPIDIYSLDMGITTFNLDTTIGQIQFNEALEKKHIKPIESQKEPSSNELFKIDTSKFIERYSLKKELSGGSNDIVDRQTSDTKSTSSDSIVIENRADNGLNSNIDRPVGESKTMEESKPVETNNIKKITIVTDGKKAPRQPLDNYKEGDMDSLIVEDVLSSGPQEKKTDDIGYRVDNYYVYGNYKYDLENIRNKLGKEHTKVFLNKLSTLDIDTYLDPSSINPIVDKKEIQTNMEIYGNRHNV
jgi:hypothetical protein